MNTYTLRKLTAAMAFAVAAAILAAPAAADEWVSDPVEFDLTAGQHIDIGSVWVWNDEDTLYVWFDVDWDWMLVETHLDISADEFDGRGAPGRYAYNDYEVYPGYYEVPLEDLPLGDDPCDTTLYLLAHAEVLKLDDDDEIIQGETAYGGDIENPRRGAWYGQIEYEWVCEEETGPGENGDCQTETAWGGNTAGGGSAWWFYYDATGDDVEQTIWAGQTIEVGTVEVSAEDDEGKVTITIELTGGWELQDFDDDGEEVTEPVKIQGYDDDDLPASRPAAGLFTTYKGDELVVTVPSFSYYAIHLDVQLCE